MATDIKLSSEFTIIYGGEVIAYCTDFTLERNKEIIDITKLGDTWKNKKVDTKDFNVSFNGMITRGDTVTASLWSSTTAYSAGDYVVLAGKAWEAQGSTTGDNPTTDDGTNWLETSAWSAATTYAAGDMVYITSVAQETRIYISLQGSNLNQDPLTETSYWERLSTNYELLLKELQNNDTEVLCTIKPTTSGETYYYGSGVLTSLSASITQGDKVTFSGSFEGSGELDTSTGIEMYDLSNAIADPNGTEANSITGWTESGLNGTGANVFESQSSIVHTGTYAFHFNSNDTPTAGARIVLDLDSLGCQSGNRYDITLYVRHVGSGATWDIRTSSSSALSADIDVVDSITSSDTTYEIITHTITSYSSLTRYFGFRATGAASGGMYVDNLSIIES